MLEKFKFTIENRNIFLFTDSKQVRETLINKSETLTKTIPCKVAYLGIVDSIDEPNNYLYYTISSKCNVKVNKELNISELSLSEINLFFPDLVYLIMCMFANIFQNENKYFMQASVVKYNDKESIMFIGEPNTGKTTLASKLLLTGNWSLISNDNVLVGLKNNKLNSISGTKNVQLRYGGIKMFFPEINLNNLNIEEIGKRDDWDIKIYIDDYLKKKKVVYAEDSFIKDIYLINTNKSQEAIIRRKELIDEILIMYEQLTKQIRSNRYVLTSFDYPIPSFENENYAIERYQTAKTIIENTGIYDLKGDVDQAVLKLRKKYEK